jgi:hypothetical protein
LVAVIAITYWLYRTQNTKSQIATDDSFMTDSQPFGFESPAHYPSTSDSCTDLPDSSMDTSAAIDCGSHPE